VAVTIREPHPTRPTAPLPVPVGDAPAFRWPVEGRVLSAFGAKPGGRFNDGVNLKASAGAPVRAAADGIIAYAGDAIPGFGNLVLIKHAGGWVTAYGHNEALLVTRGGKVAGGDVIARAGATGAVTEPQVHFELRRGRTPVDPVRVIGGK
jgi:murein DD-endopeptidase MepM/ murein hydrolase activator NlpD